MRRLTKTTHLNGQEKRNEKKNARRKAQVNPFAPPPNLLELIFRQPLSLFLYTSSYFDFILGLPHPRKPHPYRLLLTLPLLGLNV